MIFFAKKDWEDLWISMAQKWCPNDESKPHLGRLFGDRKCFFFFEISRSNHRKVLGISGWRFFPLQRIHPWKLTWPLWLENPHFYIIIQRVVLSLSCHHLNMKHKQHLPSFHHDFGFYVILFGGCNITFQQPEPSNPSIHLATTTGDSSEVSLMGIKAACDPSTWKEQFDRNELPGTWEDHLI